MNKSNINRNDIMNLINEVEHNYDVHQWKMCGIHIWPVVRLNIAFQLINLTYPTDNINNENESRLSSRIKIIKNLSKTLTSFFHAYFEDYKNNARLEKECDAIFLSHTTCRLFSISDKHYDVFCDPFIEILASLNKKSLVLEFAPGNEYRIPRNKPSMLIDLHLFVLHLKNRILERNVDKFKNQFEDYENLNEQLSERIKGFNIIEIGKLYRQIKFIRLLADWFKRIFAISKPKMGLVVTYYSSLGMAFTLACREFGIPSFDLQHGVQVSLHPAYGRWQRIPEDGFELLPLYFLCWSEKEARVIKEWNIKEYKGHLPIIIGNLYLNMFKEKGNQINEYFLSKVDCIIQNKKRTNILITLQPDLGLLDIFREAIASSPEQFFWWVRLHPGMMKECSKITADLKELGVTNHNVEDASNLPLYSLLPRMDVHVTAFSTVVLEAAQFGVPSVITEATGCEYYTDFISSGMAKAAFSATDLNNSILYYAGKRSDFRTDTNPHDYQNSVTTIKSLILQFCQ